MKSTKSTSRPGPAYTVPATFCVHRNEKEIWRGYESTGTVRHAGWLCPDCGRVRSATRIVARRANYLLPGLLFVGFAALLLALWWWL